MLLHSAFVGLVVMLILFPFPGYIGKRIQSVQVARIRQTDARIQTVTESKQPQVISKHPAYRMKAVGIIRMIKLFGWERKMSERLAERREEELYWLRKENLLEIINSTIKYVSSYVIIRGITYHRLEASSYRLRL